MHNENADRIRSLLAKPASSNPNEKQCGLPFALCLVHSRLSSLKLSTGAPLLLVAVAEVLEWTGRAGMLTTVSSNAGVTSVRAGGCTNLNGTQRGAS